MKALPSSKPPTGGDTNDLVASPGWRAPGNNPPAKPPMHGGGTSDGEGAPDAVGGGPGTVRPSVRGDWS